MGVLKNMFTWWEGATFGTWLLTRTKGSRIGNDAAGNIYYEGGTHPSGQPRRWVIYAGSNDASRVPPEWHGWLHNMVDDVPEKALPAPRTWQQHWDANRTGGVSAYRPAGAIGAGDKRAAATGDYEAWSPEA